jgi:hypothetical protein
LEWALLYVAACVGCLSAVQSRARTILRQLVLGTRRRQPVTTIELQHEYTI